MGNYGVKLRKPEDLPDFDQPSDYEEEKKRFEPIKMDEEHEEDALSEEPLTAGKSSVSCPLKPSDSAPLC